MRFRLAGLVMLAVVAAADMASGQGRPAQVGVDRVRLQPFEQTAPVLGRFVALEEGVVAARVAGPVASIEVTPGDVVAEGDELARLDLTRLRIEQQLAEADLAAARSEVATAQAELNLLVQERERLERLEGSAAFSRARLDDKIKEILVAQSRIDSAAARLARAEVVAASRQTDIDDGILRAPYHGVVVRKLMSAGAYVRTGDAVIEMVNNEDVEIEADVPTELMAGLREGDQVAFVVDGQRYSALLRAVVPVESSMTRTRAVRFVPGQPGQPIEGLVPTIGQSVTVHLPTGAARDIVTVHKDAVLIRQGGRSVFKIGDGNKAMPQPIEIGAAVGGRFEVTLGLAEGDLVVVRGNERLRPGQEVSFEPPERASEGAKEDGGKAPTAQRDDAPAVPAAAADRS